MYFVIVKEKVKIEVLNVTQGFSQYNSYSVVLGEVGGNRRLPIVIGAMEAQSILLAYENISSKRPLTHDLITTMFQKFYIDLKEVVICNLLEGVFYAVLTCVHDGYVYDIDSRTSDALAIALRSKVPIYIYEDILESSALYYQPEEENLAIADNPEDEYLLNKKTTFNHYTVLELEQLLEEALQNEDYEKAARIRDELKRK